MTFKIRNIKSPLYTRMVESEDGVRFFVPHPNAPDVELAYPKRAWERMPAVALEDVTADTVFDKGRFVWQGRTITEKDLVSGAFQVVADAGGFKILRKV
ncbi:hypothetical protein [Candidatus Nitronereus thalassa]|uniref:Uncharacterized protein n=1 Tax=Candidatus Nitronereus thalassa TaxID=3020898 RepID=A0ABU3K3F0_9BACT|nr:hypothetical protein [Candidatus Nitronereus thalassa]MDT7040884.1 hypothetical protein [Candidatus Nitronereus thalassa]